MTTTTPAQTRSDSSARRLAVPALALSLLAVLATSACGSASPSSSAGGSSSGPLSARSLAAGGSSTDDDAPDACSLLTVEDIKAATGATYTAGKGTTYDNTCRYDTSSDQVKVALSDTSDLELAKPIATEVVPVDGLPGATRIDAVVYVEVGGHHLSVATGLPGFNASKRDVAAVEALAKVAAARL